MSPSFAAILVCALGASPSRPSGIVVEQKTAHAVRSMVGMVTQEDDVTLTFCADGMRKEANPGGSPTIFRVEKDGSITRIDAEKFRKTYRKETLAARGAANAEIIDDLAMGARNGPQGGLLGAPGGLSAQGPDRGQASASPISTKPIAQKRRIAGKPCRGVEFFQDGEKIFEAWYTESPAPKWLRRFDLDESPGASNAPLMAARRAQTGIELESSMPLPAGGRFEVKTVSYKEKSVPPSALDPPMGYREIATPARATR